MGEHNGHEQDVTEDIGDVVHDFSNLPECILHHILSLMPTKEAVKTSILSTRWKNLWAFVPNIDLDASLLYAREGNDGRHQPVVAVASFMNFLERVLRLRGALNIKKFHLKCFGSSNESQIHSWISDAIKHNVQDLRLVVLREPPSMLPWSILNGTSLVSLTITTSYVSEELPSCISFPCLKTLQLLFAMFPNDGHAEKLLLGCPILEELLLLDIWMNLKNVVISNSTLKRLTICDLSCFGAYKDPTSGCKIKIDAANLTYFEYEGLLSNEILLNNASSLVKARVDIFPNHKWQKLVASRTVKILKRLRYVVSLMVSNLFLESLYYADRRRLQIPEFKNLSHLTLTWAIRTETFATLMAFFSLCPVLKFLCFSKGFEHGIDIPLDENKPIWSRMPPCVLNCLKTITFKNFNGYDSEVCFLKAILKYARVLESVNIRWFEGEVGDVNKAEVTKELETFERVSNACVIKFK